MKNQDKLKKEVMKITKVESRIRDKDGGILVFAPHNMGAVMIEHGDKPGGSHEVIGQDDISKHLSLLSAVSHDETRCYILRTHHNDGHIYATDGHRLRFTKTKSSATISLGSLQIIKKLKLDVLYKSKDGVLKGHRDGVLFTFDPPSDGDYPEVKRLIPKDSKNHQSKISGIDVNKALKFLKGQLKDYKKLKTKVPLQVEIITSPKDVLIIPLGTRESIKIDGGGAYGFATFNAVYLIDLLTFHKDQDLTFQIKDHISPIKATSSKGVEVLMPMRGPGHVDGKPTYGVAA